MNTKNLKPFDLQEALKGDPVMLRDGRKAYVRHHETELDVSVNSRLIGFALCENGIVTPYAWSQHGKYWDEGEYKLDIIGMYQRTHTINGFEVPAPVRAELMRGEVYFTSDISSGEFYDYSEWRNDGYDKRHLERGLIFINKEDAISNAKAMLGINPYEVVCEI